MDSVHTRQVPTSGKVSPLSPQRGRTAWNYAIAISTQGPAPYREQFGSTICLVGIVGGLQSRQPKSYLVYNCHLRRLAVAVWQVVTSCRGERPGIRTDRISDFKWNTRTPRHCNGCEHIRRAQLRIDSACWHHTGSIRHIMGRTSVWCNCGRYLCLAVHAPLKRKEKSTARKCLVSAPTEI